MEEEWVWEEELEVLKIEHIAFGKSLSLKHLIDEIKFAFTALIILGFGLFISLIVFIVEIIKNKCA